jgi:hypothetical protein
MSEPFEMVIYIWSVWKLVQSRRFELQEIHEGFVRQTLFKEFNG